jgi:hypothetical protein
MTRTSPETNGHEIDAVARQLRAALGPVLRAAAGGEPRTMKLVRAIAIDKSLASVLVRAVNAPSERELLHLVPSPTGLRILLERTKGVASPTASARLKSATESFRRLLDATPGGRAALDARIAGRTRSVGSKRENTSRQATFKSMSFLLGYYSELLSSTLIVVPSDDGKVVDGIEVVRRIGVHRMKPGATIPLFSFEPWPDDSEVGTRRLDPITPDPKGPSPSNLLLREHCPDPMPHVSIAREGLTTTVVLPGAEHDEGAMDFAWAFRLRNGGPLDPGEAVTVLHAYYLHMPTRRVVRDVYLAEGIYPGATPFVSWALPGTRQHEHPPVEGAERYFAQIDLAAEFEPMVGAKRGFAAPGLRDHDRLVRGVLARSGHPHTKFRGFRCALNYPVPLLDMFVWLRHSAG